MGHVKIHLHILLSIMLMFISSCNQIGKVTNGEIFSNKSLIVIPFGNVVVTEGGTANVVLFFPEPIPQDFILNWDVSGASVGSALPMTTGSISISAGATSAILNIATNVNATYDGTRTFNIELYSQDGSVVSPVSANFIINENLAPPVISFDLPSQNVNENVAAQTAAISITPVSTIPMTVNYSFQNGTAGAADYSGTSGSVTFNPGQTSQVINFLLIDDLAFEPAEDFTITLDSSSSGATIDATANLHTVNIIDNEAPNVSISSASVNEGGNLVFTVTLSQSVGATVTVDFATANGTAIAGTNYTSNTGTVTFIPGDLSETITISTIAIPAELCAANRAMTVGLSNPTNATIGVGTGTGTISDPDLPVLSVANASANEGSNVSFVASLSGVCTTKNVSFNWATATGTAIANDFTSVSSTAATITAGSTTTNLSVATTTDAIYEADETFTVTLSSQTNATLGTASATGTILNNDTAPTISVSDPTVTEGTGAGTTELAFVVTFSSASGTSTTLNYSTSDGTATTADSDYTAISGGSMTVAAGVSSATINVTVGRDAKYESNETVGLTITGGTGFTTAGSDLSGVGTINNDDTAPTISIANVTNNEGSGGGNTTYTFTVTASQASGNPIVVDYATSDGTANVLDADYTGSSGTLTIPAGSTTGTFTVDVNADTKNEANETFNVTLSGGSGYTTTGSTLIASGTITNDDALPTVQWTAASQSVNEDGASVTITAQLSAASGQAVSIPYTVTGTATGAGSDYSITASPISIAAGSTSATVTVTIVDDTTLESSETVIVTMGTPTNATASGTTVHTVTIVDNDLGAFTVSGIRNTAGTDTTDDANLNLGVNPRVVWAASTGAVSYDVTIFENDGTTVKCALQNTTSTTIDFGTCNLTVNTNYKAKVTAKSTTLSRDATNSPFDFYVNQQPTPVNDGPMLVYHTDGATVFNVLADNPATGANDPDTDPDGQTLTITAVSAATKGTRTFTASSISYDPTANQNGVETLTYTVSDGKGGSATATLTIHVMTTKTWTGNVSDLWNQAGNWCGSINGAKTACGSGAVPTSADTAVIDDTCQHNCDVQLNANATVAGFILNSGSLTQQNGITFTVGGPTVAIANKKWWIQNGGTFNGGDSTIIADKFYLNAGTFTSTSGSFNIGYDLTAAGSITDGIVVGATAVFNHNNGLVHYEALVRANCSHQTAGAFSLGANIELWNFELQAKQQTACLDTYDNSYITMTGTGQFRVMNDFKIIDGTLHSSSNVYLYGNLILECASTAMNSSCAEFGEGNIHIVGNGNNQTYNAHSDAVTANIIVNKPSGSFLPASTDFAARFISILSGTFVAPTGIFTMGFYSTSVGENFNLAPPGVFDHNSGTLRFIDSVNAGSSNSRHVMNLNSQSIDFWNIIIEVADTNPTNGYGQMMFGVTSGYMHVRNNMTVVDGGFSGNSLYLYGNLTLLCDDPLNPVACASGGSAQLNFVGSNSQIISLQPGALISQYDFIVDKTNPGDTVTIQGSNIDISTAPTVTDFNVRNGTLDLNGWTITHGGRFRKGATATVVCNGGDIFVTTWLQPDPCP